ncbi:MAG: tetratricopeptide repeat protein [Geitlerinemataceae cyanobacterium]
MKLSAQSLHLLPALVAIGLVVAPANTSTASPVSSAADTLEIARRDRPEIYPPSPLENADPDPWWPDETIPLTERDRQVLRDRLDGLNASAAASLAAAQPAAAFEQWNRELRLRRLLGVSEELLALARVGEIAWEEEEFYQLQVITRRLRDIQLDLLGDPFEDDPDELPPPPDLLTLRQLGDAYAAVRARGLAVEAYEYLLEDARDRGDRLTEEETLRTIGELNYGDLNYEEAVADYEELVELAAARGDTESRVFYLERLAFMYDQLQRPDDARRIKQTLIAHYQSIADIPRATALYIEIGDDLAATGDIGGAENSYMSAYTLSWEAEQFYRAGEAIAQLAALYEREGRYEDALNTYRTAIDVDNISNDRYGLMVTYDAIGQLYQRLNAFAQALDAYQRGLEVAQQLQSRTAYFQFQIDAVSREMRR